LQTREQTDQSCCLSDANFYYITAFGASREFVLHVDICQAPPELQTLTLT